MKKYQLEAYITHLMKFSLCFLKDHCGYLECCITMAYFKLLKKIIFAIEICLQERLWSNRILFICYLTFINIKILFFKDERTKLIYKHRVVLDSMYIKSLNLLYYYLFTCFEIISEWSHFPAWSFHEVRKLCDLKFNINIWIV